MGVKTAMESRASLYYAHVPQSLPKGIGPSFSTSQQPFKAI